MASRATISLSIGRMITKCSLFPIGKTAKFQTKVNTATWTTSLKYLRPKFLHSCTLSKKTGRREKYLLEYMDMPIKMSLRKLRGKLSIHK
jgi:hypothetical protein